MLPNLSTWLVTGATSGIGQAITQALCARGDRVIAVGRRGQALQTLKARYEAQLCVCQADVNQPEGRAKIIAAAAAEPQLAGVVHAAGVNQFGAFSEQSDTQIAELIHTNVIATLQLVRGLLPVLARQPHAQLLLVGSTFGALGYAGYASYCASKFALRGFAQALRRELADTAINVQYLAPRATRTAMNPAPVNAMNAALGVHMDTPEQVAQAAIKQLLNGQARLQLGWPEGFFVLLNAVLPGLVDRALRKQLPTIQGFARGAANVAAKQPSVRSLS